MKDGPVLAAVKWCARMASTADAAMVRGFRRARGERPHRLGGKCALCAKCCESPAVQVPALLFNMESTRRLLLWWHRRVNGFELVRSVPQHRTLVFRCTHFDPSTRRCDSYATRPFMCRDYPRALLWEPDPPLLDGCGYRAVSPHAARIAAMIDEEDLPPEARRRLKASLHALDEDEDAK